MKNKLKTLLIYGLIFSLPIILLSVIAYVFNIEGGVAFSIITFVVFIITIVLLQLNYRNSYYDGYISYGKLIGGTALFLLIAAIILYIYTYVFYKAIAPEEIDRILEVTRVRLYENDQLSSKEVNQIYKQSSKFITPMFLALGAMFNSYIQGFLISLISSIFIRKKQDAFTEAMRGIDDTEISE